MKKIFTYILTKLAMVAVLATVFAGSAWGQVSSATPSDGKSYVIAAYVSNKYYALPNGTVSGGTISGTEITLNSLNKVNTTDATGKTWTLEEGDTSGQFYIKYTDGSNTYYLYKNGTGKSNYNFAVNQTSKNYWSFITNGTGYTVEAIDRGTNHPNIQYNNNGVFRCNNSATSIILLEIGDAPSAPTISANNVDIAYDATGGSIAYTVNNGVEGGSISAAATASEWITLGTVEATVPFTCSANNTVAARIATVTLTYTYGSSKTVTKDVTVTQAADPNAVNNISDISKTGDYIVKGTIVAISNRGFIVGDGTGYAYYYKGSEFTPNSYAIGNMVKLSGAVTVYGGVYQFGSSTTIEAATESNYSAEAPTVLSGSQMDARVASTTPAQLPNYVQYEGVLSVDGTHYNITSIDGASKAIGSISYPISTGFTSLNGKQVIVKGYYVGVSSSTYYNTMIGSVEEVKSTTPTITVTPASLTGFTYEVGNGPSTTKTFTVSGSNLTDNIGLSVSGSDFEMSLSSDSGYASSLSLTPTEGEVSATTVYVRLKADLDAKECSATITLSSTGADNQTVSLAGEVTAPVVPYATLPFEYDGDGTGTLPNGFTVSGLSTYTASPKMQFNGTGDYAILQINERPGILTFDIKGNGFSGGTFKVQTSEDGITYSDLETYTQLGSTQSESFDDLGENVRYIKWIYTNKSSGNVALGNIELAKYVAPAPSITVSPATAAPAASDVTGTLDITYENLTISDMDDFDVQYCDSEGNDATKPEWVNEVLVAEKDPNEGEGYVVSFTIQANDGATRAVYFKIYALDDNTNLVYSNLVTISQAAYVAPATSEQYELFTGTLVEGDYIIYYDGVAMKNTVSNNRLSYEIVNPVNDVITTDDASIVWHIAQSGSYWTIFSADANAYAASTGAKSKAQLLAAGDDDKAQWTISGSSTYDFVNKANSDAEVNAYLRNNVSGDTNYGFACYAKGTGGALSLYKLVAAAPQDEITINATALNGKCWATFYNGTARYTLPAGAKAYTMNADHQLYLLGDGTEIPADTAVIIIADDNNATSITLRKSTKTDTVTVSGTNILVGSDSDVAKTGSQYVLGIKGGVLNFYLFNGTAIPAGKAYYE